MSFNRAELAKAIQTHGAVVRVLVGAAKGSAPRGAGAVMLVWKNGQSGTIGGGALEFMAAKQARKMLAGGEPVLLMNQALGPAIDQCCGGNVTLVLEQFTAQNLPAENAKTFLRPIEQTATDFAPVNLTENIRAPAFSNGWLAETLNPDTVPIWIFGAGHVGHALATLLCPFSDFEVTLIDSAANRIPANLPENIVTLTSATMADLVSRAPENAQHFVMTKSHRCDFEICQALLGHSFDFVGLIGSKTKWARFRSQLQKTGHSLEKVNRITCPIGIPKLGKEPEAIAVGIAHGLLKNRAQKESGTDSRANEGGNDGKTAGH